MKRWKRGMSLCLVGALMVTAAVPAYAAQTPESSEKEEVVYATLKADGSLDSTYVVNSFSGGEITDYGDYSTVKMLNTDDPIQQRGTRSPFPRMRKRSTIKEIYRTLNCRGTSLSPIRSMATRFPPRNWREVLGLWRFAFR